ncbi:MAG TPA: DUF4185 domain-containing protein [Candidatus Cybelea sp.]|nr:DUF4185 domain-containing protein [Candidatus Cybelea sp.]
MMRISLARIAGLRVRSVSGLLLLSAFAFTGCSLYPSGGSGPAPDLRVAQVTDLGPILLNPKVVGRDGGYSGVFAGYSIWVFGDTFLASPNAEGETLISDSWAFTADLSASGGITGFQERQDSSGAPAMLLQLTAAEQAFNTAHQGNPCQEEPCGARWALWPGAVVDDPARHRALVFYQLVSAQPGNFDFHAVGYSVAIWQDFASLPERPLINPAAAHPDLLFGPSDPGFGSSAFALGDELYAYACYSSDFSVPCVLGRAPLGNVLDLGSWTFYRGNGNWSSRIGDASFLFAGNPILNVSWNSYLERYVAVYNSPLSVHVLMRTAPAPEGPWSREVHVFDAVSSSGSVDDAQAHPEYNLDGGQTMFLTYSQPTSTLGSQFRLVAVRLERP